MTQFEKKWKKAEEAEQKEFRIEFVLVGIIASLMVLSLIIINNNVN